MAPEGENQKLEVSMDERKTSIMDMDQLMEDVYGYSFNVGWAWPTVDGSAGLFGYAIQNGQFPFSAFIGTSH